MPSTLSLGSQIDVVRKTIQFKIKLKLLLLASDINLRTNVCFINSERMFPCFEIPDGIHVSHVLALLREWK
jgi:hypothetical protein